MCDEITIPEVDCKHCGKSFPHSQIIEDGLCRDCLDMRCTDCEEFFELQGLESGLCEDCAGDFRAEMMAELSIEVLQWVEGEAQKRKIDPAVHLNVLLNLIKAKQLIGVDICPAPLRRKTQ